MNKETLLKWSVPFLLCIVAVTQIFLSHTKHLTPWKGGGFGMFASIDRMERRVLHITAETDWGKYVIDPEIIINRREYSRIQAMPSVTSLKSIHDTVRNSGWALDSTAAPPSVYHENLKEMGYSIYPLKLVPGDGDEEIRDIRKVHVVTKRMVFDKGSNVIQLTDLISIEK
jgi:hypothetical protein